MLDVWSRQDIINKGNFLCSVPVHNMKTDHSIIYVTIAYSSLILILSALFITFADGDEAQSRIKFQLVNFSRNTIK